MLGASADRRSVLGLCVSHIFPPPDLVLLLPFYAPSFFIGAGGMSCFYDIFGPCARCGAFFHPPLLPVFLLPLCGLVLGGRFSYR